MAVAFRTVTNEAQMHEKIEAGFALGLALISLFCSGHGPDEERVKQTCRELEWLYLEEDTREVLRLYGYPGVCDEWMGRAHIALYQGWSFGLVPTLGAEIAQEGSDPVAYGIEHAVMEATYVECRRLERATSAARMYLRRLRARQAALATKTTSLVLA